jgi:glycosyltransferase involved in cell wall biosynthesis
MTSHVAFLAPVPLDSPRGNAITVTRIVHALRARGLDVCVRRADTGGLIERAAGSRPALIHAFHAYRAGPLGLSLAKACRAPLVITLTGTDVSDDLRDAERGLVVREALLGAAAVTAFHDSVASEIVSALPALAPRLAVVPQSVHFPSAAPGETAAAIHGDPCILFPAGIRPVKRPLLPLEPLDGLLRRYPDLRLWYAGPGLDPQETQRLEREIAGRPWARYLGPVPHAAMPSLLAASDIVLNCSLSEGGMANAVLEAFALGRAVLASDIPGNRSVVEDGVTGLLFSSEAELGGGVERLAADPALRRRLGDAGRRLLESRYTPARETEGYLEVYARVTGGQLA